MAITTRSFFKSFCKNPDRESEIRASEKTPLALAGRQSLIQSNGGQVVYDFVTACMASSLKFLELEEDDRPIQISSYIAQGEPESTQEATGTQVDDGIVSSILELAANTTDCWRRFSQIKELVQLSSGYRDVVLKNPAMRDSLDSAFTLDEADEASMARADICTRHLGSNGEYLDVVLDTGDGLMSCLAILSCAIPCAARWKSFTFRALPGAFHRRQTGLWSILNAIESCCRESTFRCLEHLVFDFPPDSIHSIDCTYWNMPNLRHLFVYNFIPTGVFQSLTFFHLHLDAIYQSHMISTLLIHASSLETLSLKLVDFHDASFEPYSRVVHWGVRTVQLQVVSTEWYAMKPFYESLKFPALHRMKISLLNVDTKATRASSFVESLVPEPQWSRVSVLELQVTSKWDGHEYLELPFNKLKHLRIFSLQTDHDLMRSNLWPPLVAFQITSSENMSQMWLEDTVKDMRGRGVWDRLRIVSISDCPQFTKSWLGAVVGSKLLFGWSLSEEDLTEQLQSSEEAAVPWAAEPLVRLPIEVLEVVLQCAVLSIQPSERYRCASRLSGVSSTFRNAMFSMPILWTEIHSKAAANNDFAVWTGIKRSLGHGLHITLEVEDGAQACVDLLQIATPHAERWHSFSLQIASGSQPLDVNRVFSAMDDDIAPLTFPNMRNLNINYDFGRGKTFAEMLALGTAWKGHSYRWWKIPNLDSLSFTGVIPVNIMSANSVAKFDFILATDLNYQKPRLLIVFLASVPSLEELSLTYMRYNQNASTNAIDISANLPNLRKLSIRVKDTNWEAMRPIYQALKTPKLRDLHVQLQFFKYFNRSLDITTYLKNLLPDTEMCRLIGLHLNVFVEEDPTRGYYEFATIPLSESLLPHLRDLHVEINMPLLPCPECPPLLSGIRIINSHYVDIDWLLSVRTQMESMNTWDAVETVEVRNCNTLLAFKQDLRLVVPEDKLLL